MINNKAGKQIPEMGSPADQDRSHTSQEDGILLPKITDTLLP